MTNRIPWSKVLAEGIAIVLSILLVLSNGLWAYLVLDGGIRYTHLESSYHNAREVALQALAVLPEAASPSSTRQSVLEAAASATPKADSFEKDGFVWVGSLGLRFDATGQLVEARSAIEPL